MEERDLGHDAEITSNTDDIDLLAGDVSTLFENDAAFGEALEVQVEAALNELSDADKLLADEFDELLTLTMAQENNIRLLMADYEAGYVETDQPEPAPAPSGGAFDPKQKGVYLASVNMAPGIWRSSGIGDSDDEGTLKIMDLGGEIEDISYMPVGVSFRIPSGDFQIIISEFGDQCTWTWISE